MHHLTSLLEGASGPVRFGFTNDYMFRAVLQNSNYALRHLLSALLDISSEEILSCKITNPIILGENINDKTCILDIRVILNNNRLINLEMQTGNFTYWPNRSLFYLSRLFCNISAGQEYSQIKPSLHIGILTESPFKDASSFYSEYLMMNPKNNHIFSRNFSIRMLDLSQTDNVSEDVRSSDLYQWACLFKASRWEEIRMLAEKSDYLAEAASHLLKLSEEEKIQLQCEGRERYNFDMNSARGEGIREGIRQGRSEMAALINALAKDNRMQDILRIASDNDFYLEMLQYYHL